MTSQSRLLRIALLTLLASPSALIYAQNTPAATAPAPSASSTPPHFDLAVVHPSPFANRPDTDIEYMQTGRFIARQATMTSLIRFAWNVDNNRVLRGPSWLDFDRFDISARAPRETSLDNFRLMLRALLADRFSLVVHTDTKSMPAYVLTAGKGAPKLKPAAKAADGTNLFPGCFTPEQQPPPPAGAPSYTVMACRNETMAAFAGDLYQWAGGGGNYLTSTVVDQTGLTGSYDLQFKWTNRGMLVRAGDDAINLFDAIDKQLGLKLEAKSAPLPVVFVDSVNEKPTPNAPGLDKTLTPPPAEFEVATFRPSAPDTRGPSFQSSRDQLEIKGATLQWMITNMWDITDDMVADAPKWLNQDRWDLVAKIAHDPANGNADSLENMSTEQFIEMVKKLLEDRFGLQAHMGDHLADAYVLLAANPRMKKADPDNRTGCHDGPGPDGKDPRLTNPALNRLITCQNITMAQFGDILRINAGGYIHSPVLDQTGLTDAYDFTLSFSGAGQLRNQPAAGSDPNSPAAADPNPAVSLFDAVQKQLGVKLVQQKRPIQMLIIDHINQQPTDN